MSGNRTNLSTILPGRWLSIALLFDNVFGPKELLKLAVLVFYSDFSAENLSRTDAALYCMSMLWNQKFYKKHFLTKLNSLGTSQSTNYYLHQCSYYTNYSYKIKCYFVNISKNLKQSEVMILTISYNFLRGCKIHFDLFLNSAVPATSCENNFPRN